ncbi:MAG: hypothetical protein FWD75_07295 [Propionibacteriaceae bacterium]|nr:hypothetical protein [Propionibacteriaceae bacterium]
MTAVALAMSGIGGMVATAAPAAQAAVSYSWAKTGGYWYLYGDGVMQFGWRWVGSNWYYLDPSTGHLLYGWQKIAGDWYYLIPDGESGRAAMGWMTIGGLVYYFDPTGQSCRMVIGWRKIDGYWYCFLPDNESGRMMTGWQKITGDWYYFTSQGRMVTGWQDLRGGDGVYRFYFRPGEDGRMVGGNQMIGGVLYRFGPLGSATEGRFMDCNDRGMPTRQFWVYYTPGNATTQLFDAARARWNSAGIGVNISWSPGAASRMTVDTRSMAEVRASVNVQDTSVLVYGSYSRPPGASDFTISVYHQMISSQTGASGATYDSWFASTATHELGHALSLRDNPAPLGTWSLMNHDRNRATLISPTTFDRGNVTACYS